MQDQKNVESASTALIDKIVDKMEALLTQAPSAQEQFDFYGQDFGMERLGYIVIPYLLRRKIWASKKRLKLENGPYPPRKDGGYGWFQVAETPDENENLPEYSAGCNVAGDDDGSKNDIISHIYYYWLAKYFDVAVYHNGGLRWMCAKGIPQSSKGGMIAPGALSDEDAARLIQKNLITKAADGYSLNFPCFTHEQFEKWIAQFDIADESLDDQLAEWIGAVRKSFEKFVPSRLKDQINQFVSAYLGQIIGEVIDRLIADGTLKKPDTDRPLVYGVFYVEGEYINP